MLVDAVQGRMFRVSLIPEGGFSIAMLGAEARFDALTEDRKAELP